MSQHPTSSELRERMLNAISKGEDQSLRDCLALGVDPGRMPEHAMTVDSEPLTRAVQANNNQAVEILLDAGANPNAPLENSPFPSVFAYACQLGNDVATELMLRVGVQIWDEDTDGTPAIFYALRCAPILRQVHAAGKNLDVPFSRGRTLLHFACERGYEEVAVFLASTGADRYRPDNDGKSPVDMALEQHPHIADRLRALDQARKARSAIGEVETQALGIKPL